MCGRTSLEYLGLLSVLQGNLLLSSVESPTKYGVGRTLVSKKINLKLSPNRGVSRRDLSYS